MKARRDKRHVPWLPAFSGGVNFIRVVKLDIGDGIDGPVVCGGTVRGNDEEPNGVMVSTMPMIAVP